MPSFVRVWVPRWWAKSCGSINTLNWKYPYSATSLLWPYPHTSLSVERGPKFLPVSITVALLLSLALGHFFIPAVALTYVYLKIGSSVIKILKPFDFLVWTQAKCVNLISRTKAKKYNLSEVGHLHPYTGTHTKWFKKRREFAYISDFTCHFSMNFWKSYSKKGLVCFSWPMLCQQKVKPLSALSGFALPPGHGFHKNMGTKSIQPQENHLLQFCAWFSPFCRWDFPILHKDCKT